MAQYRIKTTSGAPDKGLLSQTDYVDPFGNLWVTGTVVIAGTPSVAIVSSPASPVNVTGVVTTLPPGHASTNIDQLGGQPIAAGQRKMDASLPVVVASDQSPISVSPEGTRWTYSAAVNAHAPAATPTDWFTIAGSSTAVVRVTRITVVLRATAASQYRVTLKKYSNLYSGGTNAAVTIASHDSQNPTATATVNTWAAGLPTVGTSVAGAIADDSIPVGVLGTPTFYNEMSGGEYDFGTQNGQPIVLRGPTQYLALNSAAAALPAGLVADVRIQWTEAPL